MDSGLEYDQQGTKIKIIDNYSQFYVLYHSILYSRYLIKLFGIKST